MLKSTAICLALLAAAVAVSPRDAHAQPAPSAPPPAAPAAAAPQPSARALELSHRLLTDTKVTSQISTVLKSMMPAMEERMARDMPEFKPEWRQALTDATVAAMEDVLPAYLKTAETLYARTFTEDELAQAVAFYESPAGRSMIEKAPLLAPELSKDMVSRMDGLDADIKVRFCAKIDACKPTSSASKPSGA